MKKQASKKAITKSLIGGITENTKKERNLFLQQGWEGWGTETAQEGGIRARIFSGRAEQDMGRVIEQVCAGL